MLAASTRCSRQRPAARERPSWEDSLEARSITSTELEERIRRDLPRLAVERSAEIARVIECLITAMAPERIYAFGSQARGDARSDSDVDILVIVADSDLLPHRRDQLAYRAIGLHTTPIDILVMTATEFESRSLSPSSLPTTVLREGRVLYAA